MTAGVILAAGRGSRLGGLTDTRPKCLVELRGRTLLSLQAEALSAAGVWPIAAVVGYRGEMVAAQGLPVFHNRDWETTGIFRSLGHAAAWLSGGPVIVSYGDIFYTADTAARVEAAPGDLAVAYDPDWWELWSARSGDPLSDAEGFCVGPDGTLAGIGGRIGSRSEARGQYMGLFRTTPLGWKQLERVAASLGREAERADMTRVLSAAVGQGARIAAVPRTGAWGEVDTPADLALYGREIPG